MENLSMVLELKEIRRYRTPDKEPVANVFDTSEGVRHVIEPITSSLTDDLLLSKSLTTLFFFFFFFTIAFGQNPIVKEELFFQYEKDGPFIKTSIFERYYKGGQLTNEKELTFEEAINDWYTRKETWLNALGDKVRVKEQYYFGANLGFYILDTHSIYTEDGQLLRREIFIKENKNSSLQLWAREEVEYLKDCSFVNKFFFRENPNDEELTFDYLTLSLYDEECRFVDRIYSQRSHESVEQLRSQIRIHYDRTSDGYKRRIVEKLTCPETFGCNEWERISLLVFDALDRIIINEEGSRDDTYRVSRNITFDPDRTIYHSKVFLKQSDQGGQNLSTIEETVRDLEDNILSYNRVEPTSHQTSTFLYNDKGLLIQEIQERSQTVMSEEEILSDTIDYTYQYHCNDLVFEKKRLSKDYVSSRTTYSYLYPIDCGNQLASPLNFTIFPNPTTNTINIEGVDFLNNRFYLELIDSDGRIIQFKQNFSSSIDVSNLGNGLYFLKVRDSSGVNVSIQSFILSK